MLLQSRESGWCVTLVSMQILLIGTDLPSVIALHVSVKIQRWVVGVLAQYVPVNRTLRWCTHVVHGIAYHAAKIRVAIS